MKKIDDVFKKSGDIPGFGYSESYWTDMEALIEKNERKRKPYYIISAALLLVFISSITLFFRTQTPEVDAKGADKSISVGQTVVRPDKDNKATTQCVVPEVSLSSNKHTGLQNRNIVSEHAAGFKQQEINRIRHDEVAPADINARHPAAGPQFNAEIPANVLAEPVPRWMEQISSRRPDWKFNSMLLTLYHWIIPVQARKTESLNGDDSMVKYWFTGMGYGQAAVFSQAINHLHKSEEKWLNMHAVKWLAGYRKNAWSASAGIQMHAFRIVSNYTTLKREMRLSKGDKMIMINPNYAVSPGGNPIALVKRVMDTSYVTTSVVDNPDFVSGITCLSLPLLVRRHWNAGKINGFSSAGMMTSLVINKRGVFTRMQNGEMVVENLKSNKFLRQTNYMLTLNSGVSIPLYKHLDLNASVEYAASLNSLVYSYNQRLKQLGIGLELVWKWN